jgi:hypothetical protein
MDHAPTSPLNQSRLRRVAHMGLAELGYRGRQESSKWIDRIRFDGDAPDPHAVLRRHAPAIADPAVAHHMLLHAFPQRFFRGATRESLTELLERFPDLGGDILRSADTLLEQRFDLLGYRGLWFGNPIDWHLDPVWSKRAPLVHWSRLDVLDRDTVGDSKVVWELNRHQWVVRLAQAYALSGEPRYAEAAMRAITQWIAANPVGWGINWASSLEVAMRLMAWTWVLALLRSAAALSGNALVTMLASMHAHAVHVGKYLSYYYSPNTHLTGEALGLFYAGTLLTEFRDADKWRDLGARTLIEQADRQISSDGIYFEQATCYQRYTCEIYLHFLLMAERNGIEVPGRTREHVLRMVAALAHLRNPDGSMPAIGDADGGWLMPLVQRAPSDCRGVFALAAAVFGQGEFASAAEGPAPETVWLMGRDGGPRFDSADQQPTQPKASRIFSDGGYAVMRAGTGREAHQLVMDTGPLGCPVSSGHGHADLLSIQASIFGEPCLVDPGTGSYTGDAEWRDYFRGTSAHSTIAIDGRSQAKPAGPFRWVGRPSSTLLDWQSNAQFDLVDAQHGAYYPSVIHRRRVLFVKPDFWIVVDDLTGEGEPEIDLTFQFAPLTVTLEHGLLAQAKTRRGRVLWIAPFSTTPLSAVVTAGATIPMRGWISPDYGQRVAAPALVYTASAALPARILTVLYPDRHPGLRPVIEPIFNATGLPVGVRVEPARTSVRLDYSPILIERS